MEICLRKWGGHGKVLGGDAERSGDEKRGGGDLLPLASGKTGQERKHASAGGVEVGCKWLDGSGGNWFWGPGAFLQIMSRFNL